MNGKYIGRRIQQYRRAANMTQGELAEKLDISTNYLSILERGAKMPRLETFIKIINALNVSADDLLMDVVEKDARQRTSSILPGIQGLTLEQSQMILDVAEVMAKRFLKN